jgi:hypothetical protein
MSDFINRNSCIKKVIFLNFNNLHKKNLNKCCSLIIYLFISFYSSMTFADDNITWINDTYSTNINYILRDDVRDRIYLADEGNSHLVVIDSKSLEVILRLTLDSNFSDMAISKDNSTIAVAGGTLYLINLETFIKNQLTTDLDVYSVAFDYNGNLLLSTTEDRDYIYHYDTENETIIRSFGAHTTLDYQIGENSLLKTDSDGDILYVLNRPYFYKFDISGTPVFLGNRLSSEIYGRDFVISPRCDEIYAPGIKIIDSNTIDVIQTIVTSTSNPTVGLAIDPKGYYVYSLTQSYSENILYQVDTNRRELSFQYGMAMEEDRDVSLPRGIAIDRTGQRAFIVHGRDNSSGKKAKVQVIDLYMPLSVSIPEYASEGEGVIQGQAAVTVLNAPSADLSISIQSDDVSELHVPSSVIIPAGQTTATFDITIQDDALLDGTKTVNVSASASGYPTAESAINIFDNETASLTLSIPEGALEGDGFLDNQGTISLNTAAQDDVIIVLSADNTGEIIFPEKVIIPNGQTSAIFDLNIIDDTKIDGEQKVTITASVNGWESDSRTISISDNEVTELTVTTANTFAEGYNLKVGVGTVSISGTLPFNLEVSLSVNDSTEISIPSSVTIPAWQTFATFNIGVIDDAEVDGTQSVTITANAEGFPENSVSLAVTDNDNIVWINDTLSTNLTYIMRDDIRDRIYLADAGNKRLVIINSKSLEVIYRISLDSTYSDMDISKDGRTLAISGGTLYLVDLETFESKPIAINFNVGSVAFDHNGDLMLVSSDTNGYIYHFDPDTEAVIKSFGKGPDLSEAIPSNGILKTDSNGYILYFAQRGGAQTSLCKFDISGVNPAYLAGDGQGYSGCGNGVSDFILSPRHDELYLLSGSPYGIQIADSNTLDFVRLLDTGAYSGGVATDPGGNYIYGLPTSQSVLYQFDSSQKLLSFHYNLSSEVTNGSSQMRGVAIDRSGKKAFIIHGFDHHEKVQVVDLNAPLNLSVQDSVYEGDGVLQGSVMLLRAPSEDITIYFESDDPTEIQIPSSILIPAGQLSATFSITILDDTILDGTKSVNITATTPGYPPAVSSLDINDNETAILSITVPSSVSEGQGLLAGKGSIYVNTPVEDDVVVSLSSSNMSDIYFPLKVIIPAGETSVNFDLFVIDDTEIEGTEEITITALVEGWNQDQEKINISDNEVTELTLTADGTFSEGDGVLSNVGVVTISGVLPFDLEVSLISSDLSEILVPASVIIPAWNASVKFTITVIDDSEKDDLQTSTITANAYEFSGSSVDVSITDNDNTWIDETFSKGLSCILRDDARDLIYLADTGNSQLVVIDTKTLKVILRLPIQSSFKNMAISKDNNILAIAGGTLFFVDLNTFALRQLSTDLDVSSVAFDHNGDLMLLTGATRTYIYHYNPDSETIIKSFGVGSTLTSTIYRAVSVKTDGPGNIMYVSAASDTLFKFDISGETPVLIAENDNRSYMVDFAISPLLSEIYAACYVSGYGIETIDSNTLSSNQFFQTGQFQAGVVTDPGGYYIFGVDEKLPNGTLYQYDAVKRDLSFKYNLSTEIDDGRAQRRGLAIDRLGHRAFIIHGYNYKYKVQVVDLYHPSDNDDDGLSDQVEVTGCTDPYDQDTDDDGIFDGIEDKNHNGIVDQGETNPCNYDSDNDGISDGVEDANHNRLVDIGETNPLNSDTDNDGMTDGWEVKYDLDPLVNDANEDDDGDGYSNLKEYKRKSIPNDYNSQPSKGMPWLPILLGD